MRKVILLVAVGSVLVASGCGDDEGAAAVGATDTVDAGKQARTLDVSMTEFKFTPSDPELDAGNVVIKASNDGSTSHELVLLKTDADPNELPKEGSGVSEKGSLGEIPDVPAGESATHAFKLKPGKYVMVCNIPGHYDAGMYGSLTVR
jgi:uncharacterized cupredoxin-like copper-binding protein